MNRKLIENLISLYGVYAVNFAIPLLTLPYLARVFGPSSFGAFAFAEAFANYITLVVEYGFSLSATRQIAGVREDSNARALLLSGVLGAQMVLSVGSALLTLLLVWTLPVFSDVSHLLAYALLWAVGRGIAPIWYFQGLERMKLISTITIAGSLLAAVLTFLFVRSAADAWIVFAFRGAAVLLTTSLGFVLVHRDTPVLQPSLKRSLSSLREGSSLFLFRGAASLYTTANVLILAIVAPANSVAWFAGAERIARAAVNALHPIVQVFYPRISQLLATDRSRASDAVRTSALLTMGAGLAAGVTLLVGAPFLVRLLLGEGFEESVPLLRLLAVLPPLLAASNLLGIQWMLPLRMDREFNLIVLSAGVLNLTLATVFSKALGHSGMALSVVACEAFVTLTMLGVLRRRRLDPWSTTFEQKAAA